MKSKENRNLTKPTEELLQWHAILFAEFSSRWIFENSSYEFDELDKETKDKVYQEFLNQNKDEVSEKPNFKNISEKISKKVVEKFYGKIKSRPIWNPDMDSGHNLPTEEEIESFLQEEVQKELEYMLDYLR